MSRHTPRGIFFFSTGETPRTPQSYLESVTWKSRLTRPVFIAWTICFTEQLAKYLNVSILKTTLRYLVGVFTKQLHDTINLLPDKIIIITVPPGSNQDPVIPSRNTFTVPYFISRDFSPSFHLSDDEKKVFFWSLSNR